MHLIHKLLSLISRTANIIVLALLIISGLSSSINPSHFSLFGFMGLIYPYLALINIFFIISWIIRKRLFFIYSLLGLFFTYNQLKSQLAIPFFQKEAVQEADLRVMSYNVRNFDLYNWSKNEHSRKAMIDTIQSHDPDILLIQEFYTDQKNFQNTQLISSLGYKYHKISTELILKETRVWGVAIFSKYPILNSGELLKKSQNSRGITYSRGAYTDVQVQDKIIRVINVHLQSVYFDNNEYETIQEIKEKKIPPYKKLITTLKKINRAFYYRGRQVNELQSFIADSPHPVILGGDFNDTPGSYSYQQLTKTLDDTFLDKGKGIGVTYNGIIPLLRIDYILKDKNFQTVTFKKAKNKYSDHYPIISDLAFTEPD